MKVLIVSNDRVLLRHLSRFLATFGYETTQVADYQRAVQIAGAVAADLLLIDSSPDFDAALDLCRSVLQEQGSCSHYTLLMIDEASQARLIDAVEAGLDDFLTKPLVYGEVLMRLQAAVRAVEFQRRAHRQRRRDPVTGLLTAAAFRMRLQAAGASRASHNGQLACLAIEADFLDVAACQLGKAATDDLLAQFASRLSELGGDRRADIAHFGDGLFCVLLPETSLTEAVQWGEQVCSEIAGRQFLAGEAGIPITASIGVADVEPLSLAPEAMLEKSKQALKTAKASGRNCVVCSNQFADEETAWKNLAAPGRLFERTVARDVMLPCTVILRTADTVGSADLLFQQTRLSSLVVVDRDEKLVGLVFAEDVADFLQASGNPDQVVSKVMTHQVEMFEENTPFADMMKRFAEKEIDLVVVVDDDQPTGLVFAAGLASLSLAPELPVFCEETPSLRSSYLQIAEPYSLQQTTETDRSTASAATK
ncbi:MAG: diguanylate cyclase [Planctomycetaceae bacterium]|nr:diguanylate cyclase [Planctomycetaceae bacterium]